MIDRLANVTKFKSQCPFLGRTKTSTLRTLYMSASPRYSSLNRLTEKAIKCPVMGPILAARSSEIAAGYASVAGNVDVKAIHEQQGVILPEGSVANVEKCPHASAALAAARMAQDLANAHKITGRPTAAPAAAKAAALGCPFYAAATAAPSKATVVNAEVKAEIADAAEHFNYERFYQAELQKKHEDKSYRYFNNINRMASKFPIAHVGNAKDQVEVWCANDYLGMGNNPIVLETMQYVFLSFSISRSNAHVPSAVL
jgi:5-aminolevulinate synthase